MCLLSIFLSFYTSPDEKESHQMYNFSPKKYYFHPVPEIIKKDGNQHGSFKISPKILNQYSGKSRLFNFSNHTLHNCTAFTNPLTNQFSDTKPMKLNPEYLIFLISDYVEGLSNLILVSVSV